MAQSKKSSVGRRGFLKGAAAGAAVLAAPAPSGQAQQRGGNPAATAPNEAALAADNGIRRVAPPSWIIEHPGADYMVDVLKKLSFEYVNANPGTSFSGLHESLLNYGGNKDPEFLTCCHEESSVAMAQPSSGGSNESGKESRR